MDKKWLQPLRYGIILGTIFGSISACRAVLAARYLDYRFYNITFHAIAKILNVNLVLMLAVSYVFALAWKLGDYMKGAARVSCRALGFLLCLGTLAVTSGIANMLRDSEIRENFVSLLDQSKWQLLAAVVCVFLGRFALKSVRTAESAKGKRKAGSDIGFRQVTGFVGGRNHIAIVIGSIALSLNLTALILGFSAAASVKSKPNVIFVMFDTCRADQLGSYGYNLNTSPNVDKFAKDSMRFERAISQATITSSSVGSLMTSRYPQSCNLDDAKVPGIPEYLPTIAEVLNNEGYSTSGIVSNILVQRALGYAHGFESYNEELKFTDITSPGVLSLSLQKLAKVKDKPFFMYLLFIDPHTPYIKHDGINYLPGYKGKLGDKVMIPDDDVENWVKEKTPEDIKYLRALYDGEINFTDKHFGILMDELKKQGLYDNTLIVFFGDHGEEFMDHGSLLHGHTVYDEATHVPLMIKLPNQKKGSVVKGTFPLINVVPSIMRYLGLDPTTIQPHGNPNVDLTNLKTAPDEYVFTAEDSKFGKLWAVQNTRYKMIWNTTKDKSQLFDLKKDPHETQDISKQEPNVLAAFLKAAQEKENMVGWKAGNEGKIGVSPKFFTDQETQRLKSLGYAQ